MATAIAIASSVLVSIPLLGQHSLAPFGGAGSVLLRRRGEAVRPRGFPRQRVAVSHCVARVPRVVASGATRRGVPLVSLFPKSWGRNLVPPIEGRAVERRESVRPVVATAADLKELLNPLGGLTAASLLLPKAPSTFC